MRIIIIYVPAQQHGTRAPVSVVAGEAILIACRGDVLLHCRPFMTDEAQLLFWNSQKHVNTFAVSPR